MTKLDLKQKTHAYIELADDKILKAVYIILESHVNSVDTNIKFSPELITSLNKAKKDHLSGKGKSYTIDEVRKSVLSKLKK